MFMLNIVSLSNPILIMDAPSSIQDFVGVQFREGSDSDWLAGGEDLTDELRLPKRRRYLGEDMSRHSWDSRGTMSTEPPTPVFLEQELVDENSILNDVVPFYATLGHHTVHQHHARLNNPIHLPHGAIHHSSHKTSKGALSSDASPTTARIRWTEEDDKLLIRLVGELGHNWPLISSRMDGRTSKQVKERWTNQLDPSISTEPWTGDDDQQLVILIRELGHSWCEIARRMKGRTESMVKNRYHANLRKRFGNHIFDPSVPLPSLTFKPKSVKTKSMSNVCG
jgi:hypothetical protein